MILSKKINFRSKKLNYTEITLKIKLKFFLHMLPFSVAAGKNIYDVNNWKKILAAMERVNIVKINFENIMILMGIRYFK